MTSIFSLIKRDKIKWILFLTGALIFSVCFSFVPGVQKGIFSYILNILRDLPLFIFGLFVYVIAQKPSKNKIAWKFWAGLVIILSCIETFTFQTMFAWYLSADIENPYLVFGLSIGFTFVYGVAIWSTLFPCLFSVKRNSTIWDGYLQSFIHKKITGKGVLYVILLEVVYNVIFWGMSEFLLLPPILVNGIFKVFYLFRFVAMGLILYWMNGKIVTEAK